MARASQDQRSVSQPARQLLRELCGDLTNALDLERALCSAERSDVLNSCGVGVWTSKACPYKIKMSSGVNCFCLAWSLRRLRR